MDYATYKRVIRNYCSLLADRLEREGMADLPCGMGTIAAAKMMRKPQYRGERFIGYGRKDWKNHGQYDGSIYAFGLVFLPGRGRKSLANLRSFGFVANRKLFQKMAALYKSEHRPWTAMNFNDDMI